MKLETNNTLDYSQKNFKDLLNRSSGMVLDLFEDLDNKKAYHDFPQKEVESWFDQDLPSQSMDPDQLLDEVQEKVLNTATSNLGPHMYAYVMAGGTQIPIIGEQLAATINQNIGKWHLAPAINEIEKRVIQWGSDMIGYGKNVGGVLVSGGSAANLAGLTVGRNIFFEKMGIREKGLFGLPPFTIYASKEVHGCVDKSAQLLGIGTDNLRKIEVNSDFTINLEALESQIREDRQNGFTPFCLIGTAGTVNTGAIDPLRELHEIAKKNQMWYHIDGAYGVLAASLDSIKDRYNGLELADSIALDYHKWLYQPFEAGCVLVRSWDTLKNSYFKKADYLDTSLERDEGRLDFNEHYFQLSRNAKALKIWMSFKSYGVEKIKQMIQKDIDLAHYLAEVVDRSEDFELRSTSDLAITCFQYKGDYDDPGKILQLNRLLIPALEKDGRVFITGTKLNDEFVIRACVINHRQQKDSIDYLVNVIREVGSRIKL